MFANAWLHESSDANWSDYIIFDTNSDNVIDITDLSHLADVWLWQACWHSSAEEIFMYSASAGNSFSGISPATASVPVEPSTTVQPLTREEKLAQLAECIYWAKNLPRDYHELYKQVDTEQWKNFVDDLCRK